MDINKNLLSFIAASPTAFHAVANIRAQLENAGYTALNEGDDWSITAPGKYYVTRNGSSIIALRIPKADFRGFMMMAAHSDSPTYKIKDKPVNKAAGLYTQLSVEGYGGMICSSWLDKPLSVAGRVSVKTEKGIETRLVNVDRDLAMIPNVAIHMDRNANDGKSYNANSDMLPLIGSADLGERFDEIVAETANADKDDILARDLFLYPRTPGCIWGAENEYISSPRLDDLQCVFSCMQGFLAADDSDSASVLAVFDNEEVGSGTKQGADSSFLDDVLQRVCEAVNTSYRRALANSFMVSADNAHAVHPNHPEYADRADRPEMNKGIVVKYNANQRYTTDCVSAAVFEKICRDAGVPVQHFTNRADLRGGSTLGNISSSHVSINTVDIGLPQLAMHSCFETAGVKDTEYLMTAAKAFYSVSLTQPKDGVFEI